MAKILIVQGSLSPHSKTATVVNEAEKILQARKIDCDLMDLRSLNLQFCDGSRLSDYNPDVQEAYHRVEAADGYIFGMPVYCYSVSGPLKNFIDLTSGAMENKVAGIICNAGGARSFMASADLVKILLYESNVLTVQPIVGTVGQDFENGRLINPKVVSKLQGMIEALLARLPGEARQ